jgi:predicted  nucleic acid-binding Zn-ribbon protein
VTEGQKKKGFLDSIASVFTDDVPDKPASRNTPLPPPPPGQAPVFQSTGAVPDQKALASLEARLQAAVPAPYAAFLEMFTSLAEDIPDEAKRVKVALKTSKTTVDQVVASLDQLVATMDTAAKEFNHSLDEKLQAHEALESSIKAKEEQLHHLQEEITALHERSVGEQTKISQVKSGFEAAHAQVVGRLQSQKTRIAGMR